MKLIVGLGNPGKKYQETWHNLGFIVVEQFQQKHPDDFSPLKFNKKFNSQITGGKIVRAKIILAQPQTYMNNSGKSVKRVADFYKVSAADITVVHDDIDLPLGKIRISRYSSAAGHRGVQSIIDELGTKNFIRLRIGIKSKKSARLATDDYVLQKINKEDKIIINKIIKAAAKSLGLIIDGKIQQAMNQFN